MKKVLLGTIFLSISLFMAGCGSEKAPEQLPEPIGDYRYEFLTETKGFEGEREDVINMLLKSDAMYYLSHYQREDSDYYLITKADYKGEILNRFVVYGNVDNPMGWNVLNDGKIAVAGYGDNTKTNVDIYDESGNMLTYIDASVGFFNGDTRTLFETKNNKLLVRGKKEIALYDTTGKFICKNDIPKESKIVTSGESGLYLLYREEEKDLIAQINEEDLTLGKATECPYPYDNYGVGNGVLEYLFTYDNGDSLYGFSESEGMVEIIRFEDSGTYGSGAGWFEFCGKLLTYSLASGGRDHGDDSIGIVSSFTKRDKAREALVLATPDYSGTMNYVVSIFNESNEDYKIRTIRPEYSDDIEDWEAYKFNWIKEGLKNKAFDMVAFDDNRYLKDFSFRLQIASLDKFIKKDDEIDLDDYFENVISTGKCGKKLKAVPTGFGIDTVVMSRKEAEKLGSGSYEDLKNYISSNPNSYKTIYGLSRPDLLKLLIELNSDEFIHGKKYNFNNQAFIDVLNEAKSYSDEDFYPLGWPDEEKEAFESGKTTVAYCRLDSMYDYVYYSDFIFSEPIEFVGLPTKSGTNNTLATGTLISLSAWSDKKDASWQFIKYFLSDEFHEGWNYGAIPINKDTYYKNSSEMGYEEIWDSNAEVIKLNPPTQEEIDAFFDLISSAKPKEESPIPKEVMDIIDDEARQYFGKQKTAEEAAEAVQERVNKYRKKNW